MAGENAFDMDAAYAAMRPHQRAMFDLLGITAVGAKKMIDGAVNAFDTTGRIVRGEPVTPDEVKRGAGDVAGVAMVGSMPFGRPAGAVGSGAPVRLPGVERAMKAGQKVEPDQRMLTMHNLTADNLLYAARKYDGNLPVPSIAVVRMGHPIENFGEISLLASPNLAKPSRSNPVFAADAYTKRSPDIVMDVPNANARKAIVKDLERGGEVGPGAEYGFFDALKRGERDVLDDPTLIKRYLAERGIPLPPPNPDSFRYQMALRDAVHRDDTYKQWAGEYIESLPMLRERILKGYSDTTGAPKYAPHTLDDMVKAMKGRANAEGFDYGMGTLRASVTPQFSNLQEIQAARGRLQPKTEWEPQSQALQDEIFGLASELPSKYSSGNPFTDASHKFEAIAEAIKRPYPQAIERELGYQFDTSMLPSDLRDRLLDLRQRIAAIPTDYFEAKPQRAVGFNEFEAALVPEDVPGKVLDTLRKAGITRVETYGKDAPGSRQPHARNDALRKFDDLTFSRGGLPYVYGYTPPPPGEVY